MNYWHLITIFLSVVTLFWSFWASHKAGKPWNIVGSILAPVALCGALIGVLLLCVPDFFS